MLTAGGQNLLSTSLYIVLALGEEGKVKQVSILTYQACVYTSK
jgi:hypothetical protein